MRKSVARVLTVISQEQKKALREVYKNKVNCLILRIVFVTSPKMDKFCIKGNGYLSYAKCCAVVCQLSLSMK